MRRIKVVHVANLDVGFKNHLGNYMRYLRDQGYEVSGIAHPGSWLTHDTTILDGIFVKVIPFAPRITPLADLKTLLRLVRYFRQERFDIVHTHTVKPGLLGRLAAKLTGIPIVIHTVHGFYLHEGMSPAQYRFYVGIEKLGAALSDSLLSQNKQDIETAIREGITPPEKIHFLGNGIDLTRFYPGCTPPERLDALRAELGIPTGQPVVGFIARLVREKGVYEFLEAAHILKSRGVQATYLAVGAGQHDKPTTVSPAEYIAQNGLENDIRLLGFRDDIPDLLSLIDLIVLPSFAEGIPRILMESAALGKPVVASRVRGNIEAVEDGKTGLLVPVQDSEALAEAMLAILHNSDRAAEMGRQARQRAIKHFDERHFFWRTDAEYRRLLASQLEIDPASLLEPMPNLQSI